MSGSSVLKFTLVGLWAVFAAACSSSNPDGATVGGGGSDSGAAGIAGQSASGGQGGSEGGAGGANSQGGTGIFEDGGESGSGGCIPTTCQALGTDCGQVADGCGALLDCGTCADGASCGIVTANVCTALDGLCVPALAADVCAGKECGSEGDGCGDTVVCGSCGANEACGLAQPFQCGTILTGDDDNCPALITDCASAGAECGVIGNGCGGTLDCGGCLGEEICGINAPQLCGAPPECIPVAAAEVCETQCGFITDGCGGAIDCDSEGYPCPGIETCGGGGVQFECGSGGSACVPADQVTACDGLECGVASNGCGGSHPCGTCDTGSSCFAGTCQVTNSCTPQDIDIACAGKDCGQVGDGCGGTLLCGTCASGESCGLHVAFECGSNVCQPLSEVQACAGKQCGTALDGCGTAPENTFACGTCASGSFCGLFEPFQCDAPEDEPCVPTATSCTELEWACGLAINNCGDVFDCATEDRRCNAFQTCSGGNNGNPTVCAGETPEDCALCEDVPTCSIASPTRLTGRVITPGRSDGDSGNQVGVPNAFVYILRNNDVTDLPAIGTGVPAGGTACDRCSEQDLGPILASAVTDGTGAFTLSGNIPIAQNFLLVTKVGKFRRAVTMQVAEGAACSTTALATTMPNNPTRLPRSTTDAPAGLTAALNLPHVAVTTGRIDAMECVLFKMGVAQSEFGNFGSAARVHLYRGGTASNAMSGARIDASTPFDGTLYDSQTRMQSYDMVVADCEGQSWDSSFSQRGTPTTTATPTSSGDRVRDYVNRGGRMFASHLSFSWLHLNGTTVYNEATPFVTGLGPVATWDTNSGNNLDTSGTGVISVGRPRASPRIENFTDWMVNEGVTTSPAFQFAVTDPRSMAQTLGTTSEEFVFRTGGNGRVQQFSFNTPYGAPEEESCGRVAYSGFHVAATGGGSSPFSTATFPGHCTNALANNGVLTNQEKVLLYMLFDLGACVGEDPTPPACTPLACPADDTCGTLPDGCGGQLNCGCEGSEVCVNNECIIPGCVPTTCDAENTICSSISDGCGDVLVCDCPLCTPLSQEAACAGVSCGTVSDGCSSTYLCSQCPEGCVPLTACPSQFDCGIISDGCDGTLDCGNCDTGEVCGAGGPNACGVPACDPLECSDVNAQCGIIGDGCGAAVNCGPCPPGQACVTVNGVPNRCAGCEPRDCAAAGAECGVIGDGCGDTVDCGPCLVVGEICGAQSPNQCGSGPSCTPQTCLQAGAECGTIGDGCGGEVVCDPCPTGQLCGITTAFQCGAPPACTPATCESLGAECGTVGDGCGNALPCGDCPTGTTCGLGEANKCRGIH
jgi:hypothetical protein